MKDPNLRRATRSEKGLLMDLLCLMFESEERGVLVSFGVPWTDEEVINAVGGDPSTTAFELAELVRKGVLSRRGDSSLFSRRLVREETLRRTRSEAGSLGGRPTKYQKQHGVVQKSKSKANHKANGKQNTESENEYESENVIETAFESFWKEYPRKVKKHYCRTVWKSLRVTETLLKEILNSLSLQKDSLAWKSDGGKFVPHPSTWLNGHGWEDSPDNFGIEPGKSIDELAKEFKVARQ